MRQKFAQCFACVVLLVGIQLHAQVDPRLLASRTDVLDVYGSSSLGARPEIITLIDNSGSMAAVAWDDRFYTTVDFNLHIKASTKFGDGGDDSKQTLSFSGSGSGSAYNVTVKVGSLESGILIKPDGNPVTYADVLAANLSKWMEQASHVRFAVTSKAYNTAPYYTYNGTNYSIVQSNCGINPNSISSSGDYNGTNGNIQTTDTTRVIDLPIPWAVFERVPHAENRTDVIPSSLNKTAKDNKHPQHLYIYDPVPDITTLLPTSTAQHYEVDTSWSDPGGLNGNINEARIQYNDDYLNWIFFGLDVRNKLETGTYQGGMTDKYNSANTGYSGAYVVTDVRDGAAGFASNTRDGLPWTGNGLPCMTRFQSVKQAIIKTYVSEQLNVWWAIRFLKLGSTGFQENGKSSASSLYNSGNLVGSPGDREMMRLYRPTTAQGPDGSMAYIQSMKPNSTTPLTFAYMNTMAQMASTDNGTNGSVFKVDNDPYKGDKDFPSCRRSFVIILSDGQPNDDKSDSTGSDGNAIGSGDPFAVGSFGSIAGNTLVPTKANFNIFTLAGVAAHVTPTGTSGWPTDSDNAKVVLPFLVKSRPTGATRRISTMTIGISMAGTRSDAGGAKAGMYKTALYGWEERKDFTPAALPMPYDPNIDGRKDKKLNPFFFEAQSPEGIADALALAFALGKEVSNAMSAPVAPLAGLGVGNQIYLGTFTTKLTGEPVWNGDLLMTGLKVSGSTIQILHRDATPVDAAVPISADNAVWSASLMLKDKGWLSRNLYTLAKDASSAGKFTSTLIQWDQGLITNTSAFSNADLGVSTVAARRSLVRFMMGASEAAQNAAVDTTSIATNRFDIMGDIINSTPAIMEFPLSMVPSGRLTTFMSSYTADQQKTMRFRLIVAADNQGIIHGFGEVSFLDTTLDPARIAAQVDELWGFIPPDIIGGLQSWRNGSVHRYLADGTPVTYVNEDGTANGIVDGNDFARILIGLGKAGRSYYCLKFTGNDPTKLAIAWMQRPDDIAASDVSVNNRTIKTMGFSTSTPSVARVKIGSAYTDLRDVFLVGGGLSTVDVDAKFQVATTATPPGYGSGTKLGRSILAFSVVDGSVVKAWDFQYDSALSASFPNMGCIASSVTPVEAIQGSFATQRVYFSDASGSVNVLGAFPSSGMRTDSTNITDWSVRHLYAPTTGTVVSTSPIVFRMPFGYPVTRTSAPTAMVPTFGVIFGTGDRNDPMDNDAINPGGGGTTTRNRLVLIMDRQDSANISVTAGKVDSFGFKDADLTNLTAMTTASHSQTIPTDPTYYLKSSFGYYLNYAVATAKTTSGWVYQKSVTPPIVLNSVLTFTTFTPISSAGACGGSGNSNTYRLCDVINPVFGGGTTWVTSDTPCSSGLYAQFNDIPSALGGVGMSGVIQAGEVKVGATGTGAISTTPIPGNPPSNMPRLRGWRIVR